VLGAGTGAAYLSREPEATQSQVDSREQSNRAAATTISVEMTYSPVTLELTA